jgi:uncharacterized membrane protein
MKGRATVLGHAIHPMLIVFPLGLLATSLVWDICRLSSGNGMWGFTAFWTIVAGVIGGLVAAIPGFIDWMAIPNGTRAHSVGIWHMGLNVLVLALFVFSLILRANAPLGYTLAAWPSFLPGWIGIGVALVSGWLGGELVEQLGVSVRPGADLQAPSSLHHEGEGVTSGPPPTRPLAPPPH